MTDFTRLNEAGSIVVGEWQNPGCISPDGVAIVGHDDRIFLLKGSNDYHDAYHQDVAEADVQAEEYLNYAYSALSACNNVAAKFLLTIVPNKATVLNSSYPLPLGAGITPRLSRILDAKKGYIHSPVDLMRAGGEWFRRNDTHFTYGGNIAYVNLLMRELGVDVELGWSDDLRTVEHPGDLGGKFDPPMAETVQIPGGYQESGTVYKMGDPERQHTGSMFATYNPKSLVDKTLMVFGNSFSEAVPSWGMSPYFAHIFKRYFFHWGNEIDVRLIERLRPDFVVLQTCERFLSTPPKSLYPELADIEGWPE
ncbi:hypothetical protein [Sphingobium yanoikuyae]|uniref:hypothetical protein n=1 Tax=Sphingobium yanoikuyae TaxID=13690 RepID=UPI0035C7A9CA